MGVTEKGFNPGAQEGPAGALSPTEKGVIREELERILQSKALRSSRRSQQFLKYVVEHALEGQHDRLKERTIGIEVFGRDPSYDTGDDSVVRVNATEVRRRLTQYYSESEDGHAVRIELQSGSYVPEFHWAKPGEPVQASTPLTSESPKRARFLSASIVLACAVGAVLLGAFLLRTRGMPSTPLVEQFWAPVLKDPQPVLICIGRHPLYRLSEKVYDRHPAGGIYDENGVLRQLTLAPDEIIHGQEIIPSLDQFIGAGDVYAALLLAGFFGRMGKVSQARIGSDVTLADLHNSPSVLIGAFSNRWTMEMTRRLHFRFDATKNTIMIREQAPPSRVWSLNIDHPTGIAPEDFALVTRVFDSETGQLIIIAAGLFAHGCQASVELLTREDYLSTALHEAPMGWQRKNLQLVLHTKVSQGLPGPPQIVATYYW